MDSINLNLNLKLETKNNKLINNMIKEYTESVKISMSENASLILGGGDNVTFSDETKDMLTESLKLYGFKITPEILKIAQALISAGFPVTKDNISLLNRTIKLLDDNIDKALFFVKNEMEVTDKNISILDSHINRQVQIKSLLETLMNEISKLDNNELKNTLISKFLGDLTLADSAAVSTHNTGIPVTDNTLKTSEALKTLETNQNTEIKPEIKPEIKSETKLEIKAEVKAEIFNRSMTVYEENDPTAKHLEPERLNYKVYQENSTENKNNQVNNMSPENIDIPEKLPDGYTGILPKNYPDGHRPQNADTSLGVSPDDSDILADSLVKSKSDPKFQPEMRDNADAANNSNKKLMDTIIKKYTLNPENTTHEDIGKFYKQLKSGLDLIKNELLKHQAGVNNDKIYQTIENIEDNIKFESVIKNTLYAQVPFYVNGKSVNSELFVFSRDHKKKSTKLHGQSALISLNLLNLGHVETYILKNGNKITCQFRTDHEAAENIIKNNMGLLIETLRQVNLDLSSCSYKRIEEPFNLTDDEPCFEDTPPKVYSVNLKA